MQLTNQTILITGGSSGIGLELAKQLLEKGNKVLICGRSLAKLEQAQQYLPGILYFQCDLEQQEQRTALINWIKAEHPELSLLINNAAITHKQLFSELIDAPAYAEQEMQINFLAPVQLCHALLPTLQENTHSAIINVTTGLVYTPTKKYPFYNATKAALHSFTQVLRLQENEKGVKVVEVFMPVVDTPFHQDGVPESAISPAQAVQEMLKGLTKGKSEIRVGLVKVLYYLNRLSPKLALRLLNKSA
jgi:uncharacterized oxidoreductase